MLRKAVKALGILRLTNFFLHCFPAVKRLPGTGIRYRARRVESLSLSVEMFERDTLYKISSLPADIRSFVDLGCNVGYFTCWLADRLKNRQLNGLLIDANTEAVEDARWHAKENGFQNIHVFHGLAGVKGNASGQADFYLHTCNVCSSATPPADERAQHPEAWKKISMPCINVEQEWNRSFGDLPCDLLKVDIEGAELDFFNHEIPFLARVRCILVEWHKWKVSLPEIETFLAQHGFQLSSVLADESTAGTAIFSRKPTAK
jgi:FkbM family methyltransferase